MRRILFVKELGKRQGQGAGPEYKAGETHTFNGHVAESYAQAYIDRGFAVEAPLEPVKKPIAVTPMEDPVSAPKAAAPASHMTGIGGKAFRR